MNIKRDNKVRIFVIIYILLLFFGFYQVVRAETEIIKDFNANITIQKDGSILVTEKIVYDFGANQRHGIFRDIPLTAVNGPQLNIIVSEVKNEVSQPYQYTTSLTNNVLRIKIGDPNVLVTGVKTYIISYQVYNAIRTFSDHNELYWNVTGNKWPVAIQNASASVILPDSSISNIRMDCFTGPRGSTQKNCTFNHGGSNVNYLTTQSLNVNEGLTVVLGMPLGYIHSTYVPPQQTYSKSNTSTSNSDFFNSFLYFYGILSVLSVFLIIIILVILRVKSSMQSFKTAKPKPVIPKELRGEPITVEYNPPDNLSPIEIGTLLDRQVDITDISSVVIDLAVRGYIKIRYTVQEIRFWPDKKDFELIKLKDGTDLTRPADKIIFELLFDGRDSVKLSDMEEQEITFQLSIEKIKEDTERHLYNEGYFDRAAKNKTEKLETYLSVIFCIVFAAIIILKIFPFGAIFNIGTEFVWRMFLVLVFMSILPLMVIVMVLYIMEAKLTHKLTPKGISTFKKILGFREFLQLTEKDKLQLLNVPELQPEMFERFLPYAMVLGVEDKWTKKFEGIYNTIPNWYENSTVTSFNSYVLVSNLALFNNSFNKVFNITSPVSSSGFGGGGHSGGGSGGGGGGSW